MISAKEAERAHLLRTAEAMAAAARTAPKTKGADFLEAAILVEDAELERLAAAMEAAAAETGAAFFSRDANCVRKSAAVLLLGVGHNRRGFGRFCGYCGLRDCADCQEKGAGCAFDPIDLGIAIGSAVSVAADRRVDARVMMSAGIGAKKCGFLPEETAIVFGIPLSVSGKSPYFDR
ncbi:MAG: DUF2148 domain-containing protein [Oscillospiraceae bacterium]|nr:DUF2148 domain-containing protein [Oscillospiraceae bacterium]